MPRQKGAKNNTTYHYKVIYDDYFEEENTVKNKLYNIEYSNSSYRNGFI